MPGLLQRFMPREESFYDLFAEQADNVVVGAKALQQLLSHYTGVPQVQSVKAIAIVGVGAARRLTAVRWGTTRRIVWAWILTVPGAALLGSIVYRVLVPLLGHVQ